MFEVGTKTRLLTGLSGIFVTIIAVYLLVDRFLPKVAIAACIALTGCIVIYFMYRWQIEPPLYDQELREIRALAILSPLVNSTFLPFSIWAMEPEALLGIVNYIESHGCETIIECGSGVSTIVIGNLLKQRKRGHLYSLEDDEYWYGFVSELINNQELEKYVTLVYAPPQKHPDLDTAWYSADKVRRALQTVDHFDLAIIDGPKSKNEFSRFPALSFFWPWLDNRSLVILDDANRSQEQAVLARWQRDFDIELDVCSWTSRGQAYIRLRHDG